MKTLCVDARLIHAYGIGTYLKSTLAILSKDSRFQLMALCNKKEHTFVQQYTSFCLPFEAPIYSVREQMEYRKKIPRCDLFWSPHFNVPLAPIKAKKRIATIHDVYHLAHFDRLNLLQKMYAQVLYNSAFALSDCIVTVSEFSKREIVRCATLMPKKIVVIPNPLDFPPPAPNTHIRDLLLAIGSEKPHKNLLTLLKAYLLVKPQEPLHLVGVQKTSDISTFIAQNSFLKSQVILHKNLTAQALTELYCRSKLFIYPSTYEGFGYPPLEAIYYGSPVIASQAAAIPEICEEGVEYFNPHSVESIASAIGYLLHDVKRREELVTKGKKLLEKKKREKNLMGDLIDACCNCP